MNQDTAIAVIAVCWTTVQVTRIALAHRRTQTAAARKAADTKETL